MVGRPLPCCCWCLPRPRTVQFRAVCPLSPSPFSATTAVTAAYRIFISYAECSRAGTKPTPINVSLLCSRYFITGYILGEWNRYQIYPVLQGRFWILPVISGSHTLPGYNFNGGYTHNVHRHAFCTENTACNERMLPYIAAVIQWTQK